VRTESPTSAHPGDKAVITSDGTLHGWIGGSCSEPLVRREALVAMSDGMPRLVRIRPVEEVAGDDPATIMSRAQIKAGRGDVPGALAELGTLPATVRAPAQAWIDKAQARTAALFTQGLQTRGPLELDLGDRIGAL